MGFDVEILPRKPDKIYSNVTCDGCGKATKNISSDEYLQPDDALILRLEGGYGMAIDPCCDNTLTDSKYTKIFCKLCLKKLCEQWPTFLKTIQEGCSSSMAHHCSKVRSFIWEPISCCATYCNGCGRSGSYIVGLEIEGDIYSRRVVNCLTGCGLVAPGIWSWEIDNYVWSVQKWNPKTKKTEILETFSSKEEAYLNELSINSGAKNNEIHVEKMAIIKK